jgi:hypothetical protein
MPPKKEMADSFERDIIPFQVDPPKHLRIGMTLILFSERHEEEVEEVDKQDETENAVLIPEAIDDGDEHEELEAGMATLSTSE